MSPVSASARWGIAVVALLLAACAREPPPSHADAGADVQAHARASAQAAALDACRETYRTLDARVEAAGVADGRAARIAGFPYLRIDRLLAADGVRPGVSDPSFDVWIAHLRDRDLEARGIEIANLDGEADAEQVDRLERCARALIDAELATPEARGQLLEAAAPPEDYDYGLRVLGLYPFTSLAFYAGVQDLHESMRASFATPLDALPRNGRLVRYRPPPAAASLPSGAVAAILAAAEIDALGIPRLDAERARRLLEAFAPVYEIDVAGADDRIGAPYWLADGSSEVDVGTPVVYTRIAFTRFEGRLLTQLVYSVWFPARPPEGGFDLLSGHLDGITLRVTLDSDGRPLLYDSIHNCGCYHLFVPAARLVPRPPSDRYEEPLLVPQRLPEAHGRVVVRIAERSHYIERLYVDEGAVDGGGRDVEVYAFRDDDTLRSLPLPGGGRRSLFAPDGVVAGSERAERWFYWPMGIPEPGAMRQWGWHPTAFIGRRHFDDPDLVERYFYRAQ